MSRLRRSGRRLIATVAFLSVFAGSVTLGSYLGIRNVVDSDTSIAQAGGIDQSALAVALTPPMGWNGDNRFGRAVTASMVEAEARALVRSGMKAAGDTYAALEGGGALASRESNGALSPNPFTF